MGNNVTLLVPGGASPWQTRQTTPGILDGFIQHSVCQGYCASDLDTVSIIDQADEKLFQLVLTNPNHVLSSLLRDRTDQH